MGPGRKRAPAPKGHLEHGGEPVTNPSGLCKCGCGGRTTIARWSHTKSGYVNGKPKDYIQGHNNRQYQEGYEVRDCGYETPCWVWTGRIGSRSGYGWLRRNGVDMQAHRAFYQDRFGPLPPGHAQELHHLCENPPCCNPDHLKPSTVSEHRFAHSKMTPEGAELIRASDKTHMALAREFGVSPALIWMIRNNRAYT